MKAFVLQAYGSAEQLTFSDIETPVPGDDDVLIRIRATSVNPYDWHCMRGEPYLARLMGGLGLRRPARTVLGADIAGQVEAVGRAVTHFRPGDDVYAFVPQGGFAEYARVPASALVPMPANLSYQQAAAVPLAACTAFLAVCGVGAVQSGQKVLINGASGGVGTFAVQVAKAYGAEVTGVCRTRNVELIRSIGADHVIDYATMDFTRIATGQDLLIDIAGSRTALAARRSLKRKGAIVVVGGPAGRWLQPVRHLAGAMAAAPFISQRVALADLTRSASTVDDLRTITGLIEAGRVTPVIDRTYPFADIPTAVRYQEAGHAPGKVVVAL